MAIGPLHIVSVSFQICFSRLAFSPATFCGFLIYNKFYTIPTNENMSPSITYETWLYASSKKHG